MPRLVDNGAISASLTYDCDLACRYCLRDSSPGKKAHAGKGEMPIELFLEILGYAAECGYSRIGLTGGEVTRYPHLFEVLEFIDSLGWHPMIETNGHHRSKELIDKILAHCSPCEILVSIDSKDPEVHERMRGKGSWQSALDTLSYLVSCGVNVVVNTMVTPHNFNSEPEIVEFVRWLRDDLGVNRMCFARVVDSGRGVERGAWDLYPQKKLWFRRILDKHGMFGGFTAHLFHYKDTRPAGGSEHYWDCQRILSRELSLSPNGFHPCIFQHGIVLAELEDYREFIESNFNLELNNLRCAALAEKQHQPIFSCAECTNRFRRFVEQVQGWTISEVEVRPRGPHARGAAGRREEPHERQTRPFTAPDTLQIFPVERCVQNCSYCHFDSPREGGAQLELQWIDKALQEAQFIGAQQVVLNGGEPLLYEPLEGLLAAVRRYGLRAQLVSNGQLFEQRRDLLAEYRDVISTFWLSLNSADPAVHEALTRTPGSFERVLAAIRSARQLGLSVGSQAVLLPENYQGLLALLRLLRLEGVDGVILHRCAAHGRGRELAGLSLEQEREVCAALQQNLALVNQFRIFNTSYLSAARGNGWCGHLDNKPANLDWNGRVHPCSLALEHSSSWRLPSIKEKSLYECLGEVWPIQQRLQQERLADFRHDPAGGPFGFCEFCLERYDDPARCEQFSI